MCSVWQNLAGFEFGAKTPKNPCLTKNPKTQCRSTLQMHQHTVVRFYFHNYYYYYLYVVIYTHTHKHTACRLYSILLAAHGHVISQVQKIEARFVLSLRIE